jgi:hypothetical protein
MGFWHTGYLEFKEPTGLTWEFVPKLALYTCAICGSQWPEPDSLLRHRFESHPAQRPVLIVRGQELGATPYRITREAVASEFIAQHSNRALVNDEPVPLSELGVILARPRLDRLKVELANDATSAIFDIRYSIASSQDCEGVEQCFNSMIKLKRLDPRAVEGLIGAAESFKSASTYLDGICTYLYGVLSKERYPGLQLSFERYREKFELASATLVDFDRPLARLIRSIVSFHLNHFEEVTNSTAAGPLHWAAKRFQSLLSGGSAAQPMGSVSGAQSYPEDALTDLETARIIRWAIEDSNDLLHEAERLHESLLASAIEYDRLKLRVIFVEHLLSQGDAIGARGIAKMMRNNAATVAWAESVLARTSSERNK